jgi:hypothetical protein
MDPESALVRIVGEDVDRQGDRTLFQPDEPAPVLLVRGHVAVAGLHCRQQAVAHRVAPHSLM